MVINIHHLVAIMIPDYKAKVTQCTGGVLIIISVIQIHMFSHLIISFNWPLYNLYNGVWEKQYNIRHLTLGRDLSIFLFWTI